MKTQASSSLLIGAHLSISGGVHYALYRGQEIGATTLQIFTANQRQWNSHPISQEEVSLWEKAKKETKLQALASHSSYLINLGSPVKETLYKGRKAFKEELKRCHLLNLSFLVFHPGAALDSSEKECLNTIVESLLEMKDLAKKDSFHLLIETTAGQGSSVGYCFDHLAYLIEKTHRHLPIGVCVDTCHIFSAGYDIRTEKAWEKTLEEFHSIIGEKYLFAFHLNDSLYDLGEKHDRHVSLGKGKIGLDCFRFLMQHPKTQKIPKYLETPDGEIVWKKEIQMLRNFAEGL